MPDGAVPRRAGPPAVGLRRRRPRLHPGGGQDLRAHRRLRGRGLLADGRRRRPPQAAHREVGRGTDRSPPRWRPARCAGGGAHGVRRLRHPRLGARRGTRCLRPDRVRRRRAGCRAALDNRTHPVAGRRRCRGHAVPARGHLGRLVRRRPAAAAQHRVRLPGCCRWPRAGRCVRGHRLAAPQEHPQAAAHRREFADRRPAGRCVRDGLRPGPRHPHRVQGEAEGARSRDPRCRARNQRAGDEGRPATLAQPPAACRLARDDGRPVRDRLPGRRPAEPDAVRTGPDGGPHRLLQLPARADPHQGPAGAVPRTRRRRSRRP